MAGEAAAAAGSPVGDAFLREQAQEARLALTRGVNDLKAALAGTLDPRQLPRRFPFITVGAVAVAGFAAAWLAIPSREEQELRRLERIRRAMYPEPEKPKVAPSTASEEAEKAKPALWVSLLTAGIQAARPILVNLVTASLKARQEAAANPPPAADVPTYNS